MTIHFSVGYLYSPDREYGVISKQYLLVDNFPNSHYLSALQYIRRRIYILITPGSSIKGLIMPKILLVKMQTQLLIVINFVHKGSYANRMNEKNLKIHVLT